jgi:hypothetical protein
VDDLICYRVEPASVAPNIVTFRLDGARPCLWGKTVVLRDGLGGSWDINIDPSQGLSRAENGLYADQVHNGQQLSLWKADGIGGKHVLDIGNLSYLQGGTRVVFTWHQDSAACGADSPQRQYEREGPFRLRPAHSLGSCLDVAFASTAHLANIIQGDCWQPGLNQQWTLRAVGSGYFNLVASHSQKCLDVAYMDKAVGAKVIQGDCWGGLNQAWKVTPHPTAPGYVQIKALHSQKCLKVAQQVTTHMTPVVQGDCAASDLTQRWLIAPA